MLQTSTLKFLFNTSALPPLDRQQHEPPLLLQVKGADANDDNPDLALTRAEWLEVLVRVAKAKFGARHGPALAPCLEALVELMRKRLTEDAEANVELWRGSDFRDEWRRTEFYVEATDKVGTRSQGHAQGPLVLVL